MSNNDQKWGSAVNPINIEDFWEGPIEDAPFQPPVSIVISSSDEESDRDASPCPSPPALETPPFSDDEDFVPGTPQSPWVPGTPASDNESIPWLPLDEELSIPPPSPEFGDSSPEL